MGWQNQSQRVDMLCSDTRDVQREVDFKTKVGNVKEKVLSLIQRLRTTLTVNNLLISMHFGIQLCQDQLSFKTINVSFLIRFYNHGKLKSINSFFSNVNQIFRPNLRPEQWSSTVSILYLFDTLIDTTVPIWYIKKPQIARLEILSVFLCMECPDKIPNLHYQIHFKIV